MWRLKVSSFYAFILSASVSFTVGVSVSTLDSRSVTVLFVLSVSDMAQFLERISSEVLQFFRGKAWKWDMFLYEERCVGICSGICLGKNEAYK